MKMKVSKWFLLLGVCCLVMSLFACSQSDLQGTAQPTASGIDRSDQLYIEITANAGAEYFYDHKMGLEEAGKFFGVKTEYTGPMNYDMDAVIATMEQAIGRNPAGILIVGWEESLLPVINKSVAQGIPVVTVDADVANSNRVSFVGTGNYDAGRLCGERIAELVGGSGKVAILGKVTLSNILERVRGCEAVWSEKYPNIEFVGLIESGSESSIAATNLAAALQRTPDIKGVCSVDSEAGAGAIMAIREAGLSGKVKIVSFDRGSEILQAVKDGIITESIVQQTALMPFYGLNILYNLKNCKVPMTKDDEAAGMPGIPPYIDTGVTVCNQQNVDLFMR
jgi:ribose transport system substrate-binding protein